MKIIKSLPFIFKMENFKLFYESSKTTTSILEELDLIENKIMGCELEKIEIKDRNFFIEKSLSWTHLNQDKIFLMKSKLELLFNESPGKNECYCLFGINENGKQEGLTLLEENETLELFNLVLKEVDSKIVDLERRKVDELRNVIELKVKKIEYDSKSEIRIGLFGEENSGKSTLIGVLVNGKLDDGNGLARSNIFRYQHEYESGKTSNLSHYVSSLFYNLFSDNRI